MKLSFMGRFATGFLAVVIAASTGSSAFAGTKTWVGAANTTTGNKWGTSAIALTNNQFASNWSGNTNPSDVAPGDNLIFGTSNQYSVQIVAPTAKVANNMTFSTAPTAYSIAGGGITLKAGIVNNSGNTATISSAVVLSGNQSFGGNSGLSFGSLDLKGFSLSESVDATVSSLSAGAGSSYTTTGGTTNLVAGTGPETMTVSGGTLKTGVGLDTSNTTLAVQGGTFDNGNVYNSFLNVSQSGGVLELGGLGGSVNSSQDFVMSGGSVKMYVDGNTGAAHSTVAAAGLISFAGATDVKMITGPTPGLAAVGTTFNLFQGSTYAGNFSTFTLSGSAASPWGTMVKNGSEWTTGGTPVGGQYLVFQAQTGNLVVVPEPSTIVFAGLGVAMSGWTMWKKRRLSKLLAAKAG